MKRKDPIAVVLFALVIFLPGLEIAAGAAGYRTVVRAYPVQAVIFGIVFCLLCCRLMAKAGETKRSAAVLLALMVPLTALGLYFHMIQSRSIVVTGAAAVCAAFALAAMLKTVKPAVLKGISLVIFAALVLPAWFIALVWFGFGQNTVVNTVTSPGGTYRAVVTDSDQGALGGDTFVDVYFENEKIDLLLLELEKAPLQVYTGPWGAFEGMFIYWEAENRLVINGSTYAIP